MFNIDDLNETVAQKVLDAVRPGLTSGLGVPKLGEMCVEAAVCYALGLPHSDDPKCVDQALRAFKITLNDSKWYSNKTRAKGLERLAIAQLGTLDTLNTKAFIDGLVVLAKIWAEQAQETANAFATTATAATTAAARAADYAAHADAASDYANAAAAAALAARYANAAARAASDYARAASDADKVLAQCAEDVVQLLISMNAPGTKYLYLTGVEKNVQS